MLEPNSSSTLHDFWEIPCKSNWVKSPAPSIFLSMTNLGIDSLRLANIFNKRQAIDYQTKYMPNILEYAGIFIFIFLI